MQSDIFDFWADVPPDARWHPADKPTLDRVEHHFVLDCVPGPIKGPLKTAPVVLLALSPGYHARDIDYALSIEGQAYTHASRTGLNKLPSPDEHAGSAEWVSRIIKQFGADYESARDKVAVLNIGAYHSETFEDWHMLTALASSRAALNWAQSVLFPQAERGERVVICLRSAKLWGLKKGECNGGTLYAPKHGRSGIMNKGPLRDEIARKVRERIKG